MISTHKFSCRLILIRKHYLLSKRRSFLFKNPFQVFNLPHFILTFFLLAILAQKVLFQVFTGIKYDKYYDGETQVDFNCHRSLEQVGSHLQLGYTLYRDGCGSGESYINLFLNYIKKQEINIFMGGLFYDKYQSLNDIYETFAKKQLNILPVLNYNDDAYINVSSQIQFYQKLFNPKFSQSKQQFVQNGWYTVNMDKETTLFMFSSIDNEDILQEQFDELRKLLKEHKQFIYLFVTNKNVLLEVVRFISIMQDTDKQLNAREIVIITPQVRRTSPYQFKVLNAPKVTILTIKNQVQLLQIEKNKESKKVYHVPVYVQFSKYFEVFQRLEYNSDLFDLKNSVSTYTFFKTASDRLIQLVRRHVIPPSQFDDSEVTKTLFCAATAKTSNQFWFCMQL